MTTIAGPAGRRARPLAADRYEKLLAVAAVVLLATVLIALAKGRAQWALVPAVIWVHLLSVSFVLALTPVLLLRARGDATHRWLGKLWVAAMVATAAESFLVRVSGGGRFSVIHLISVYVVVAAPLIWWTARTHRVAAHRRHVRGMVTGALLIAGFFTLPFGRLLGQWLFA